MIRKAKIADVKTIQKFINQYAKSGEMLPRSLNQIYEELQNYFVIEKNKNVLGCCELFITWEDLAEIKALAVYPMKGEKATGRYLLKSAYRKPKS